MTDAEVIQIYENILDGKKSRFGKFWNQKDALQKATVLLRYIVAKLEIPEEDLNITLTTRFFQDNCLDGIVRIFTIDEVFKEAFPHLKRIPYKDTPEYRQHHSETIKNLDETKWARIKFGLRYNRYTKEYGKKLSDTKLGELNHSAVLKAKDIPIIRQLFATGNYSTTVLGEMFGVKRQTIRDVVTHRTWKHIE